MANLVFTESDPGYCRIYFKDPDNNNRLVCYQECGYGGEIAFELMGGIGRDGEPGGRIDMARYLDRTQVVLFPKVEQNYVGRFNEWLLGEKKTRLAEVDG